MFWRADKLIMNTFSDTPDKSREPTAVGACRSAVAVHAARQLFLLGPRDEDI